MKPTEKEKTAFKAKLKKQGLGSVDYTKLTKWQKDIYNGLKSVQGRSGVRVSGKFIATQQERKIKKLAGSNIDLKSMTPAQKKAVDNVLAGWIKQETNDDRTKENVLRYNTLLIDGRPVNRAKGIEFISQVIQLFKNKGAAAIIFTTYINEKTRTINVILPRKEKK